MSIQKLVRVLGTVTLLAGVSSAVAMAQTQPPAPQPPTTPPPGATTPAPTDPARNAPIGQDKSATQNNSLIGLTVLSSDGKRLGTVQKVAAEADGKVKAIHVQTGGFLGLGGKIVAISEGKYSRSGDTVQLTMTADEVSKLPEVKEQS